MGTATQTLDELILQILADGEPHPLQELRARLAMRLCPPRGAEASPGSLTLTALDGRISRTLTALIRTGQIVRSGRGKYQLSVAGSPPVPSGLLGAEVKIPAQATPAQAPDTAAKLATAEAGPVPVPASADARSAAAAPADQVPAEPVRAEQMSDQLPAPRARIRPVEVRREARQALSILIPVSWLVLIIAAYIVAGVAAAVIAMGAGAVLILAGFRASTKRSRGQRMTFRGEAAATRRLRQGTSAANRH